MTEKNQNIYDIDTFYDIESLHNIFTLAYYVPSINKFYIVVHSDLYENGIVPKDKYKEILNTVIDVNSHQFKKHNITLNDLNVITLNQFMAFLLSSLEHNQFPRFFGWNSHNYDDPLLSYILWKYKQQDKVTTTTMSEKEEHFNQLENTVLTAKEIREFSDKLINNKKVYEAFERNYEAKTFYYSIRNKHKFIDVQSLNELMQHESLKRVSAQLGLKILESDKLSGENAYVENIQDIGELSAYNYVDVINMYIIFNTKPYFGPFNQKSDIVRRFDDKYQGQLGPDTTSASLVEHMIVPVKNNDLWDKSDRLIDNDVIHFFYPTRHDDNEQLMKLETKLKEMKIDYLKDNESVDVNFDRKTQELLNTELNLDANRPRYQYNAKTEQIEEDLLEMAINEYQLPQEVYDFYAQFRNKPNIEQVQSDIESHNVKNYDIKDAQQNHTNVPLYTDRLSITVFVRDSNSYLTFSSGGIHGEYVDQFAFWDRFIIEQQKQFENKKFNDNLEEIQSFYGYDQNGAEQFRETKKNGELAESLKHFEGQQYQYATYSKKKGFNWKKKKTIKNVIKLIQGPVKGSSKTNIKAFAKTVDATNVGHDDIDSMYPSLLKALEVFKRIVNGHVVDDYSTMLDERLKLKYFLEDLNKKGIEWTEENYDQDRRQKENKLFLNSASGKADGNFDNKIRVNNKMLSARLNGQLILAYLVYKITDHGGLCVSSNTDGVYYTGISNEKVKEINERWCYYFRMGAEPETIHRFISKSSNDRIEIMDEQGKKIKPSGASILAHDGYNIIKKSTKPNIVDNMLVKYFKTHPHPLREFDKTFMKKYLENMIQASKQHPEKFLNKTLNLFQWCIKDGIGSNQYYVPINLDTMHVYDKSHTKRMYLVKDSDYVLAKYVVNNQMKSEDTEIRQLLIDLGYIQKSTNGRANKKKPSYLSEDFSQNKIEIHQEDLEEIDIKLLDNLDLDKYIDIAEEVWQTWSGDYVEIYQ